MNLVLYFLIAAFVVFLDLFTKFLVKGSEILMSGGVIDLIPGVFRFRYVENPGAAMGSFVGNRWVFMVFSTVAIIAISVFLVKQHKTLSRLAGISLALVAGGGIGNMYERLFNQNAEGVYVVTDFFDFYLFSFWKWVFNVADVAVCVGAGLLILYLVLDLIKEYRYQKNPALYDELVALDALTEDQDSVAELMLLDGVTDEPESPLIWTSENDSPAEATDEAPAEATDEASAEATDEAPAEATDEASAEDREAPDGLSMLEGVEDDAFPIYHADDADNADDFDGENDFFVEDSDDEEDIL